MNTAAQQELEANLFAMALLMPEEWVRREVHRSKGFDLADPVALKALAKKFQVSEGLMAIRVGQISGLITHFPR